MNTNKIKIIAGVVVLIIIAGLVWFFTAGSPAKQGSSPIGFFDKQEVSKLDPTDTTRDFYDKWLKASQQASADPSIATLSKAPILSKALKAKIASAQAAPKTASSTDPVLCQVTVPAAISMRSVYTNKDESQVLVTSKDKKVTSQAMVTLNKYNDGWYINDIQCSLGEFAPEKEFSFEQQGFLLKASVPKPYDPKNWHLVFTENDEPGHVAPLFFDATSQCTAIDGTVSVCKPEQFTEASKVYVRAQMTETGASVKKLEFVK
jgi:hypothetical protein